MKYQFGAPRGRRGAMVLAAVRAMADVRDMATSKPKSPSPAALDALERLCRERGGRMTPHRRAVLARLMAERRPLSAYELRDLLLPADPSVTPASVYRCLDFLVGHGLVHRLETTRAFVACGHPEHAHAVQFLICRQCGTVVEAEDQRVAAATESLGTRLGFALDQRTVELTGICGPCSGA